MNDRVNTLDTSVGYGQTLPQADRQRVLRQRLAVAEAEAVW